MWWWNDYYYWPMPWMFMPFIMFLFIGACLIMMFFMMRRMGSHGPRKSTMEMLDESLARGEISKTQYKQLKEILQS